MINQYKGNFIDKAHEDNTSTYPIRSLYHIPDDVIERIKHHANTRSKYLK
jgi:hypothetical protein